MIGRKLNIVVRGLRVILENRPRPRPQVGKADRSSSSTPDSGEEREFEDEDEDRSLRSLRTRTIERFSMFAEGIDNG